MSRIHISLFLAFLCCLDSRGDERREVTVSLQVPDSAWTLTIDEIAEVKNELWVVARVSRDDKMMGLQVISTRKASVKIPPSDLSLKIFVVGKTWGWKNEEPITFLRDRKQIEKDLDAGLRRYKRGNP